MRLTPAEVRALERYVGMIERASKSKLDFLGSGEVAFTPGAMLAVAVANFAYEVYKDYGHVALTPEDIQMHFKSVAKELAALEARGEDAPSLDIYARFRRDLMASKKSRR